MLYITRKSGALISDNEKSSYIIKDLSFISQTFLYLNIIFNEMQADIDQANCSKLPDTDRRILFDFQEPGTSSSWMFQGIEINLLYNNDNINISLWDVLGHFEDQICKVNHVSKICLLYVFRYITLQMMSYSICTHI